MTASCLLGQLCAYSPFQRETARQQPEVNKLYETWPLRIVPLQILNDRPTDGNPPLKVVIAPPSLDFDKFGSTVVGVPKLEKGLAEGLRHFFGQHYPLEHAERPVEFLGGAWDATSKIPRHLALKVTRASKA